MPGVQQVLIPPHPGITSALGLLTADLEYHALRTAFAVKGALNTTRLQGLFTDMEAELAGIFAKDGMAIASTKMLRQGDLRYVGQGYELKIDFPAGDITDAALEQVWAAFHDRHRAEYGHAFKASPIEIVTVKVRGIGEVEKLGEPAAYSSAAKAIEIGRGACMFRVNDVLQTYDTPYLDRATLPVSQEFHDPAILVQTDTTTVVPPSWRYHADRFGTVRMTQDDV